MMAHTFCRDVIFSLVQHLVQNKTVYKSMSKNDDFLGANGGNGKYFKYVSTNTDLLVTKYETE